MPAFSNISKQRLAECDPRLQQLFNEIIKTYDCTILVGHRGQAEQDQAVHDGKSQTPWPTSKHNSQPSMAVDACPYPVDWNNIDNFIFFAGYVLATADRLGIKIRWGGNWDQSKIITRKGRLP